MRTIPFATAVVLAAALIAAAPAPGAAAALGAVRLAGSPSPRQGQLQVQVDGEWMSAFCQLVNGDEIELNPLVICRQLGFTGGTSYYLPKDTPLPAGNDTVLTGALMCNGSEATLADCKFEEAEGEDIPNCTDMDYEIFFQFVLCDGAVQIEELRLAGGPSPYEGRVELRLANNSEWGTLCGTWSTDSDAQLAQVVCRQLGFEPSRALARGGGIYGGSSLQAAATAIACTGEEELLEDCRLKLESQGCEWGSPAFGVSCNGSLAITGIRLADGLSDRQGRLEVQLLGNDSWGSVCAGGFASNLVPLARLACRSLGFSGGAGRGGSWYGGEAPPAIADLQCGPEAEDLNDCSFATADTRGCTGQAVGVACDGAVDEIEELRLVDGPTKYEGRVEARINGSWSTVGSDFNPGNAAQVVCRQLGYASGVARGGSLYGMGAGAPDAAAGAMVPVQMIGELSCNGSEASLNDCSWWTSPGYGYPQEVACDGAQTVSALRLTNNGSAGGSEGRLEVQIGDQWGTVCGFTAWFDQGSAAATCTQLGFPGPARIVNGTEYSSDTSLPIIIAHVACAANQTSLNACAFDRNTPENPTCEHGDDVGLVCTGSKAG